MDKIDKLDEKLDRFFEKLSDIKSDTDVNTQFRQDTNDFIKKFDKKLDNLPCCSNNAKHNPIDRLNFIEGAAMAVMKVIAIVLAGLGTFATVALAMGWFAK